MGIIRKKTLRLQVFLNCVTVRTRSTQSTWRTDLVHSQLYDMYDTKTETCSHATTMASPVSPILLVQMPLLADPNGIGYNVNITHSDVFLNNTNDIQVFVTPRSGVGTPETFYGQLCERIASVALVDDLVRTQFACPCSNVCYITLKALAKGNIRNKARICSVDIWW